MARRCNRNRARSSGFGDPDSRALKLDLHVLSTRRNALVRIELRALRRKMRACAIELKGLERLRESMGQGQSVVDALVEDLQIEVLRSVVEVMSNARKLSAFCVGLIPKMHQRALRSDEMDLRIEGRVLREANKIRRLFLDTLTIVLRVNELFSSGTRVRDRGASPGDGRRLWLGQLQG